MRRAAKRDLNEEEIVQALRQAGASVQYLNDPDVPDLLVGKHGVNILFEIKNQKGKLKPGQKEWHETWEGQVAVVRTIEEALSILESCDSSLLAR